MLKLIFIVLSHWNNSLQVDILLHSDILFQFQDNESLLLLLTAAFLADKQQMSILKCFVWPEPMNYHSQGEHAYHDTTDTMNKHDHGMLFS